MHDVSNGVKMDDGPVVSGEKACSISFRLCGEINRENLVVMN